MNQRVRPVRAAALPTSAPDGETFIYFLRAGNFVKIGHSRHWKQRMENMQTGSPHTIVPLLVMIGDVATEGRLHGRFHRDHFRGEWFHMSPTISTFIKENLKSCVVATGETSLGKKPRANSWDDR